MATGGDKNVEQDRGEFAVFGPFRLLPSERSLERDGVPVEIGGRAFDILVELVGQAGKVVGKSDLISSIWRDTTVVEGVLRTHVCSLRKALGEGDGGARYITSVAGRGYCFVAPVVRARIDARASLSSDSATTVASVVREAVSSLPPPLARMAGRAETTLTVVAQLMAHRFVTILGAAGIGKTTVAVAVGHTLLDDFGGAVRFIELGSVTDPAQVAPTVASTLGVPTQTDDPNESLRAFLQDKRVLLILDNCEHVVNAAADLAERLFLHAPRVHLLITSRESLRVQGEYVHHLRPLETPMDHVGLNADSVQTFPAVQVFLERAAASGWSGELTDRDVPIVAETCRRLDGVPLAIELAASFVGPYGLQGLPALLDDRVWLLLQRGRRTSPLRQQTINALIAWSYDRLPEHERTVLRRLSVFVGTFSDNTAKAVAFDGDDSSKLLPQVMNELIAKSLLSIIVEDGAVVYRLLETTRICMLERLAESGEFERVSLLHAKLFAECVDRAADLGNVRAALKWSLSSPIGYAVGVRLAAAAARLLLNLGLVTECHDWCRKALHLMEERDKGTLVELALVDALAASTMYSTRGLDADLRSTLSHALELARALGSREHQVRLLGFLNAFLIRSGDWYEALEVATQSMAAAPGSVRAHWMLALSHHGMGNHALAQEHCEEGLRLASSSREEPMMHFRHPQVLMTLARTLWLRGQPNRSLALARRVTADENLLNHPVDKCVALLLGIPIFFWCGEHGEAERLVDIMTAHVEQYSLASHRGVAMALRGTLLVRTGRPQDGCTLLKAADSMLKTARNASHGAFLAAVLAEGLAATGSLNEALVTLGPAIEESQRRGGARALPELLRLKGVILASRSATDHREVDATLSSAIELARRQGALAWELRATTSLAHERLRRGGAADVLGDLSTIYSKFTEGLETPDLQAARVLLEGHADE